MWLRRLEVDRLRNLRAVQLDLGPGLTVLVGRNGQGKTALLEAVYLLAAGRTFRTTQLDDVVAWEGGPLRVAGEMQGSRGSRKLRVFLDSGARSLSVDDRQVEIGEFLGRLSLVALTAERMEVLRGGPDQRRRFLDRGIVALDPGGLRALGLFRRVLQQRNALLRAAAGRRPDRAELATWDERLIVAADRVHQARRRVAVLLAARLAETSPILFPGNEALHLRYHPSPEEAAAAEATAFSELYAEALRRDRERDVAVGHTWRGPHRDDLIVELDGVDLRRFGSAGQVRGAMLALKLGKLSLLRDQLGEAPVFLMDDFDSDLDEVRARAVAGYLQGGEFQALVATSKPGLADRLEVSFARVVVDEGGTRLA